MSKTLNLEVTDDVSLWLDIQRRGFKETYDRYQDDEISPFTEDLEKISHRFANKDITHYLIKSKDNVIGGLRVKKLSEHEYKLGIIFIFPEYQNLSLGGRAVLMAESLFKDAESFELDTILQEGRNIHFYEKLGYKRVGIVKNINEKMDIVSYKKYL